MLGQCCLQPPVQLQRSLFLQLRSWDAAVGWKAARLVPAALHMCDLWGLQEVAAAAAGCWHTARHMERRLARGVQKWPWMVVLPDIHCYSVCIVQCGWLHCCCLMRHCCMAQLLLQQLLRVQLPEPAGA